MSPGENNVLDSFRAVEQGKAVPALLIAGNMGYCLETKNQDKETCRKWATDLPPRTATADPGGPWVKSWTWRPEPGIAQQ